MNGLLSTREAAKILGLAPQTLASMRVKNSKLRFVKLGRRVLYDPKDLAAFIDANRRANTADHAGDDSQAQSQREGL